MRYGFAFFLTVLVLPCMGLKLISHTFQDLSDFRKSQVCVNQGGQNRSPDLEWNDLPRGTQSLLIFAHDPDAPHEAGFVHWVVYVNDLSIKKLAEGMQLKPGVFFAKNGLGRNVYYGPCPPRWTGWHRYNYTLYALGFTIDPDFVKTSYQKDLINKIHGHILGQSAITGFYQFET